MDGRKQGKMFTEIAELAVSECNGTVFGGYVRDFLRHENAAKKFYATNKGATIDDYANPEISPETSDRRLIPTDIDVHFRHTKDYRKFRTELRGKFYQANVVQIENIYTDDTKVHHMKMNVSMGLEIGQIVRSLQGIRTGVAREVLLPELTRCVEGMSIPTFSISIDILVSEKSSPPFSDLDFECNGLVLTKDGIGLCSELRRGLSPVGVHRTLMNIMTDIDRKIAVLVSLKKPRWEKMANKGWDLGGGSVEKRNTCDATCTLCLDEIEAACVYKFSCCNASYHRMCMAKIITTGQTAVVDTHKCPHCRQRLDLEPDEVELFGAVIVNF
jgi:hypothetical protein